MGVTTDDLNKHLFGLNMRKFVKKKKLCGRVGKITDIPLLYIWTSSFCVMHMANAG